MLGHKSGGHKSGGHIITPRKYMTLSRVGTPGYGASWTIIQTPTTKMFIVGEVNGRGTLIWDAVITKCRWECEWIKENDKTTRSRPSAFGPITAMTWYIGDIDCVYLDSATVTAFKNGRIKSTQTYSGGRLHDKASAELSKTAAAVIFSDTGLVAVRCRYTHGIQMCTESFINTLRRHC
jgi:hypothetical protein